MNSATETPSASLIKCERVSLTFRTKRAHQQVLANLNLQVTEGQILTLLGPSGCGKSTLLRVIAGLTDCDSGQVRIRDALISKQMPMMVRHEISFVFQESALLPWRTVWQNVILPLEIRGVHEHPMAHNRCEELLSIVGLTKSDWNKLPSQLSGGMKMRASIARAMSTSPKILLLDEPFAALDDVLRSKLNDLLLAISIQQQCTMLFVTHNIAEAIYLSNQIAIMSRGQIVQKLNVPFAFPRDSKLRSTSEFAAYYGLVSEALISSSQASGSAGADRQ